MEQKAAASEHKEPQPARFSQPPTNSSKHLEKENEHQSADRKIVRAIRKFNPDANQQTSEPKAS
jgi:hypothetical protein